MSWNRCGPIVLCLVWAAMACGAEDPPAAGPALQIFADVPEEIDTDARYLFYLHGAIIERAGVRPTHPKFGIYEYQKILEVFAERGFVVISEVRPAGTDGTVYAATVAGQVRALLVGGVSPEHITLVGFSKGGGIAITASSILSDERLNFVFMGACGPWLDSRPEIVPRGRLLALREASDNLVGSCDRLFERTAGDGEREEITLELGGGHGVFYRPQPEWVDPVVEWASAKYSPAEPPENRSGGDGVGDEDAVTGACRHDPPLGAAMAEAVAESR